MAIAAPNDPKNIKIFNTGGPELDLICQSIIDREIIMLYVQHIKKGN